MNVLLLVDYMWRLFSVITYDMFLLGSDACKDDGTDVEHGSKSQSSLLHEADLVEPEERRMLYNEQKSLHIHLKAEIAKLFRVIKVSVLTFKLHVL